MRYSCRLLPGMREGAGQASGEEGPQCSNLGSMAAEERREIPLDTPCQLCPSSGANRRASDFQGCWFESLVLQDFSVNQ